MVILTVKCNVYILNSHKGDLLKYIKIKLTCACPE